MDAEFFNDYDNSQILLGRNQFDAETTYDIDFKYTIFSEKILTNDIVENIKEKYLIELNEYDEYVNSNKYGLLGLYDFEKITKFKIYDYSGNSNHIYIQQI